MDKMNNVYGGEIQILKMLILEAMSVIIWIKVIGIKF